MTISSEVRKAGPFAGNDVTTSFPFAFKVFLTDQIEVVKAVNGVESVLVEGTDYSVNLSANQNTNPGGTVVLTSALETGDTMVVTSRVQNLQPTDLTNQGGFYPRVINDALDRATIQIQQLREQVDRSAKLPITSAADAESLVADIVLLAANNANLNTVANNIDDIKTVADDLNEDVSEIHVVATNIENVNTVGLNIAAVNEVSANIDAVTAAAENMDAITDAPAQASAAAASAAAAALTYDNFDDRYLGPKNSAPATDNDGNPLIVGAVYWDTPSNQMFTWNGTEWRPTFLVGNTVRSVVTATAGQTVVPTPTYLIGSNSIQVYVNGNKKILGVDYTETTQNSITMSAGLTASDKVELIAQQSFATDELRSDLVSAATGKGAALVGFKQLGTGAVDRTALDKMREWVSVKDFGAVGDGVADDAAEIQAAINYADSIGIDEVRLAGSFVIGSSITVPVGVVVVGSGRKCEILPSPTGSFTGGFCFLLNTNGTTATVPFPNKLSAGIKNLWFKNPSKTANRRAVLYSGSSIVENLRGTFMTSMVRSLNNPAYSDNSIIRSIHSEPVISAEYQVELAGLGDGANIGDLHFPKSTASENLGSDGSTNGVRVRNSLGFVVRTVVGGNIRVDQSVGLLSALHLEQAQIYMTASNITIADTYLCPQENWRAIVCQNATGGDFTRGSLVLQNVEFARMYGLAVNTSFDVELDTNWSLHTTNAHRRHLAVDNISNGTHTGILICNKSGAGIAAFNNFSHVFSERGFVSKGYIVTQEAIAETMALTPSGISTVFGVSVSGVTTTLSGAYFYKAQVLLDASRRIGRTTSDPERSATATNNILGLAVSAGNSQNSILRLYRGTATGAYTEFVDIPLMGAGVFYDDGTNVNGYPWISRTSGPVDTLNGLGEYRTRHSSNNVIVNAVTIPTVGTWAVGDQIWRTNPAAGGSPGWICTTAGAPGTWKAMASLAA